ncbi:hypothetical protein E3G69_001527 [Mycobacteroides abscessus]|nr:hypothetical protein [Mycobacteroides abscessus]QOF42494.1 hypothetical protein E3G69_001527 [Mycobacteroides abscessus]QOF47191.1 hypothetical protein E3G70_001524 [Mycobacteroides abscessus]
MHFLFLVVVGPFSSNPTTTQLLELKDRAH